MSWNGWFSYDGNEVVNSARTEAYVQNAHFQWFRPLYKSDSLAFMLGDGMKYTTPLLDDAPWVDQDVPESYDFYGFYPLDVNGIEDSTRVSEPVESLLDGGTPGRVRHTTKTIVFNGILLASSTAAADYGMRWLKSVLLGNACGPSVTSACNGAELCYLSAAPCMELDSSESGVNAMLDGGFFGTDLQTSEVSVVQVDEPDLDGGTVTALQDMDFDGGSPSVTGGIIAGTAYPFSNVVSQVAAVDPEDCLHPYQRSLRKVVFNGGPTLTIKHEMEDCGVAWMVQFTAVAGNPYEIGAEVPVIAGFLDPDVLIPWAGGVEPDGAATDMDGYIHSEKACAVPTYQPIYDPLFPAVVPPPAPPSVPLGNYSPPLNWRRRQFTIPKQYVPLWGVAVPKLEIHARTADLRNLRIRFYADPFEVGDISDDPCAYCGDIVVSYIPKDHTLVLDGSDQVVYVTSPGGERRRADSLVFKTDGTPFEWPSLSCGFGYVVTLDLPQTQATPVVDLSLFARAV